jgi:hypothetical protein
MHLPPYQHKKPGIDFPGSFTTSDASHTVSAMQSADRMT